MNKCLKSESQCFNDNNLNKIWKVFLSIIMMQEGKMCAFFSLLNQVNLLILGKTV